MGPGGLPPGLGHRHIFLGVKGVGNDRRRGRFWAQAFLNHEVAESPGQRHQFIAPTYHRPVHFFQPAPQKWVPGPAGVARFQVVRLVDNFRAEQRPPPLYQPVSADNVADIDKAGLAACQAPEKEVQADLEGKKGPFKITPRDNPQGFEVVKDVERPAQEVTRPDFLEAARFAGQARQQDQAGRSQAAQLAAGRESLDGVGRFEDQAARIGHVDEALDRGGHGPVEIEQFRAYLVAAKTPGPLRPLAAHLGQFGVVF